MAISGSFTAGTFTGEQLLRFANNLAGVAAEQPTGTRFLDGTVTVSEVSSGRCAGAMCGSRIQSSTSTATGPCTAASGRQRAGSLARCRCGTRQRCRLPVCGTVSTSRQMTTTCSARRQASRSAMTGRSAGSSPRGMRRS